MKVRPFSTLNIPREHSARCLVNLDGDAREPLVRPNEVDHLLFTFPQAPQPVRAFGLSASLLIICVFARMMALKSSRLSRCWFDDVSRDALASKELAKDRSSSTYVGRLSSLIWLCLSELISLSELVFIQLSMFQLALLL